MPRSLFDLSGKTAIVTGASRGIGAAAAIALAEAGADIVACSRNQEALKLVVEDVRKLGRNAVQVMVDVSDRSQIQAAMREALREFGKVDVLVNSAGTIIRKPSVEMTEEEWSQVIDLNLKGTFFFCQEVAREMIARNQGGKIINIASLWASLGVPNLIGYASSKGGVGSLTRSLAAEWAKYRINVNAVGPGYIRTELNLAVQNDANRSAYVISRIPLGRWGEPEDLKGAMVFLASKASDYVTGQIIWVDGGWTAT
jgi:NAD(P)-dependent dehydrogenase (short-subunit alcohol dehydrogenase family)